MPQGAINDITQTHKESERAPLDVLQRPGARNAPFPALAPVHRARGHDRRRVRVCVGRAPVPVVFRAPLPGPAAPVAVERAGVRVSGHSTSGSRAGLKLNAASCASRMPLQGACMLSVCCERLCLYGIGIVKGHGRGSDIGVEIVSGVGSGSGGERWSCSGRCRKGGCGELTSLV